MSYMGYENFTFGSGEFFNDAALRTVSRESSLTNYNERRKKERERLLELFRIDNEKNRKPCPVCNNLVRPELLGQHNDAYHPRRKSRAA